MKKILVAMAVAGVMLSTGCTTMDSLTGQADTQVSTVELAALQTREFTATKEDAFNAVVGAFQDYGWTLGSFDPQAGILSVKGPTDAEHFAIVGGASRNVEEKATVTVTAISKTTVKIRIGMVRHTYGTFQMTAYDKEYPITDAKKYQDLFSKIQKSLFLKQNL